MSTVRVSAIAAIGENRELGKNNQLLWNIPGELKRFKEITLGHPIIMGRRTFESIGRVLPQRPNIIITSDDTYYIEGATVVPTIEQAIAEGKKIEEARLAGHVILASEERTRPESKENGSWTSQDDNPRGEVFIIGGGKIFTATLPLIDRLYLTLVQKAYPDADVFFPEYGQFTKVVSKEEKQGPEFSYTFVTLEK